MNAKANIEIRELSMDETEAVSGGVTAVSDITLSTNIVLPHIARDKDLLTPAQIEKLFPPIGGFSPPIVHG